MLDNAVSILYGGMVRRRNVTLCRKPSFDMTKPQTADTDVHFTPPPVPDGDAPMNIIRENTRMGPTASVDRSIVLYPTVVMADIVWKTKVASGVPSPEMPQRYG